MSQEVLDSAMEVFINVVGAISPIIIVLSVAVSIVRIFIRAVTRGRI